MENEVTSNKRTVLLVTTVGSFLVPFMGSSVNVALPSLGKEFAMDAVLLGWVTTSYLLALAIFLVPFGRLADIHGRKKIFLCGITIYTLSCFLSGLAPSAAALIALRVFQATGSAMIFGTGIAILTSVFPPWERGRVLGINVATVYLGLSAGPFVGGLLTEHIGWRSIFFATVPLGLLIIILVSWKLKGEWAEARGEKFDLVGSIIYSLTLIGVMYGVSLLPARSGAGFIFMGLSGLFLFIKWEGRVKNPVLDINLFRNNRVFAYSNLAALISYCATFAISFLLSLYLQYTKGFGPRNAGLILVSQPVMQAIFSPLAGRLSDRIEPRIVASFGMFVTAVGLFLLTFLNDRTTIGFIVGNLLLLGFGFALFSSPNTNAVMGSIERRSYGVASGTLGTMRSTGMMLSMGIVMLLFSSYMGRVQVTPETYSLFLKSMKTAFVIFTILCIGGILASLARGKMR